MPTLTGKSAEKFERELANPPSEETIELFRKARIVYEGIERSKTKIAS